MFIENSNTAIFRGETLKRRIRASVSEFDALRTASKNPQKYRVSDTAARPNMFKARDDAVSLRASTCSLSDPWVREMVQAWSELAGQPPSAADFWREPGFASALRAGYDIIIRRYLDDDGWAWIVVRDSPSVWSHKRRLPEVTRAHMVAAQRSKK